LVYTVKTVVLRPTLDLSEAEQIVENRKTSRFRSMLQKPSKTDVHVHSLKLSYEAFLILSIKFSTKTSGADAPDEIPIVEQLIIFSIGTLLSV